MHGTSIVVYVYAALLLAGGIIGFFKSASKASLISGVLFGLALLECGADIWGGGAKGLLAALVLAGVMSVMMASRFSQSRKFMPAGLVAVLSLAVAAWLAVAMRL